jgi:hypothetical protein
MNISCTPAMADALKVIFDKEDIAYYHGVGPACIAISIQKKDVGRVCTAIDQWYDAISKIRQEVFTQ